MGRATELDSVARPHDRVDMWSSKRNAALHICRYYGVFTVSVRFLPRHGVWSWPNSFAQLSVPGVFNT